MQSQTRHLNRTQRLPAKQLPHASRSALEGLEGLLKVTASAAATTVLLGGCSSLEGLFGSKVDYRSQATKTESLEVPPDLTQLSRDGRFRTTTGTVSASGIESRGAVAATTSQVAPTALADMRIERMGQQRWLVVPMTPEQVWPVVKAFWTERGFSLEVENAQTGVMETAWTENRTKIPDGFIRRTIGRVFDALYSSGERDRFRTRLERTAGGTEIYVSHRAMEEAYTSVQKDGTTWRPKPSDPQVEAEMLSSLMIRLGMKDEVAREKVAQAAPAATTPTRANGATPAATGATSLVVQDEFDRAWRRVGLALDRSGFSVEDRDRAAGLFFVRYVDPSLAGKDEPSFLSKWFSKGEKATVQRLRVQLKSEGGQTTVTVQNSQGAAETGDAAQRIIARLSADLR